MLNNILKISIAIILLLLISACTNNILDTNPDSIDSPLILENNSSPFQNLNPIDSGIVDTNKVTAHDKVTEYISQLIAEFEAETPSPDGTTASMLEYSEKYLELWQGEINKIIADDNVLSKDFADFSTTLDAELSEYADSLRENEDAPYGSEISYMLVWRRAERLCQWFCEHYSK